MSQSFKKSLLLQDAWHGALYNIISTPDMCIELNSATTLGIIVVFPIPDANQPAAGAVMKGEGNMVWGVPSAFLVSPLS